MKIFLVACLFVTLSVPAEAELQCGPVKLSGVQECMAGIDSNLAHIEAQQKSQWCWAACISMIFSYYGHSISQARIVREAFGSTANIPGQPWQIVELLNRRWTDDNGDEFEVSGDVLTSNAMAAAQDLAEDHPLIIGTNGHAVVLTAVTYVQDEWGNGDVTEAIVRDPWPGLGRRLLSPAEWQGITLAVRITVE